MGMFDYVRCLYPLPDDAPERGWQTKDTPNQYLDEYTITEDGRLLAPNGEALADFHGDVEFYHSNICGVRGDEFMTDNDEPFCGWEFTARFTDGRLTRLTGGAFQREGRHLTHAEFNRLPAAPQSPGAPGA